jgi:hypothetical protein
LKVLADRGESLLGLGLGLGTVISFDLFGDTVDTGAKSLDGFEHRPNRVAGASGAGETSGHPRVLDGDEVNVATLLKNVATFFGLVGHR